MNPRTALRLATYLLVSDGIAALYLAGLIGPLGAGLVGLALAVNWWHEVVRQRVAVRAAFTRGLVAVAAIACAVDLLYLARTALDGMVRVLLFLILLRLFRGRSLRDLRHAGFLSFFLLVAATAATSGVGFLLVYVVFVVAGTWMLMLQHVTSEHEEAAGPAAASQAGWLGRPLAVLSVLAAAATFLIAGGLFFAIPRVGLAALPFRTQVGAMVSGFSDRVELGAFGEIETDPMVAMRVHFVDGTPSPELLPNLRWRGIVFDHFDGRSWTARHGRRSALRPLPPGDFIVGSRLGDRPVVRYEVYLEPIGTEIIFGAPQMLRLNLRAGWIVVDDMGSVSVPSASARLHYVAESELEKGVLAPGPAGGDVPPAVAARYLQLPPLSERIPALARRVTAGSRTPYEAALRLTGFLAREYRYTLSLERKTSLDPVEEFLFVSQSGNCEYFAASLAVMLRSLGIPARVVSGFQRGEWNPYGRYFMVRLRDAHSWVEAYLAGVGWVTLDPSPRAAAEAVAPGAVSLYLDALRMRWYRYVINWSLRDQVGAAATIRRQAGTWRPWLATPEAWSGLPRWAVPVALLLTGCAALVLWRRGPSRRRRRPPPSLPEFYARALRALARRGLRPEPGETAREFLGRVERAAPSLAGAVARLTTEYERCRFGGIPLATRDAEARDADLGLLERPPRRSPPPAPGLIEGDPHGPPGRLDRRVPDR